MQNYDKNTKIWFVSDTHFGHKKLCAGYPERFTEYRRYQLIEEMAEDIIDVWNKTVGDNDVVYFLGDFVVGLPWKLTGEFVNETWHKLKGQKIWITGNHDRHKIDKLTDIKLFERVDFVYDGQMYHAKHFPFETEECVDEDYYVHGHTHSTVPYQNGQNCACWDAWYRPVNITELKPYKE